LYTKVKMESRIVRVGDWKIVECVKA
jgi:hypothetical protein